MYAETIPNVTEYDCASESEVLDLLDIVKLYTSQGHDLAVYYAALCQLSQVGGCEMRGILLLGYAIEMGERNT